MKKLIAYVDESGSYCKDPTTGIDIPNDEYYIISILFIDENSQYQKNIGKLNSILEEIGIDKNHQLHCMPMINRDNEYYKSFTKDEVKKAMISAAIYIKKSKFKHITIVVAKNEIRGGLGLRNYIQLRLSKVISTNDDYFRQYDSIEINYDNGASLVRKEINNGFDKAGIKNMIVKPKKDDPTRGLEICDCICALTLINCRFKTKSSMPGEIAVFGSDHKQFCKDCFNIIDRSRMS